MTLFSLLHKINKYRHARSKWIAAGRPLRTDERIAEIWDNHCSKCDKREADKCSMCGCFIRRNGVILNKIAWGTERCDLGCWEVEIPNVDDIVIGDVDKQEIEQLEREFEGRKEYINDDKEKPLSSPFVKQKEKGVSGCCD